MEKREIRSSKLAWATWGAVSAIILKEKDLSLTKTYRLSLLHKPHRCYSCPENLQPRYRLCNWADFTLQNASYLQLELAPCEGPIWTCEMEFWNVSYILKPRELKLKFHVVSLLRYWLNKTVKIKNRKTNKTNKKTLFNQRQGKVQYATLGENICLDTQARKVWLYDSVSFPARWSQLTLGGGVSPKSFIIKERLGFNYCHDHASRQGCFNLI